MNDINEQTMTTKEKKEFTNVRIWMKVYRLSEICTADGQHILQDSWTGHHISYTHELWPRQTKPGIKIFRFWQ